MLDDWDAEEFDGKFEDLVQRDIIFKRVGFQ